MPVSTVYVLTLIGVEGFQHLLHLREYGFGELLCFGLSRPQGDGDDLLAREFRDEGQQLEEFRLLLQNGKDFRVPSG
jgi:hypothetical protein